MTNPTRGWTRHLSDSKLIELLRRKYSSHTVIGMHTYRPGLKSISVGRCLSTGICLDFSDRRMSDHLATWTDLNSLSTVVCGTIAGRQGDRQRRGTVCRPCDVLASVERRILVNRQRVVLILYSNTLYIRMFS